MKMSSTFLLFLIGMILPTAVRCGLLQLFRLDFSPNIGQVRPVTVSLSDAPSGKLPVIVTEPIVRSVARGKYMFPVSTGEITVKIKQKRWQGLSVGTSDRVEISGELKRDKTDPQKFEVDVKFITICDNKV